ncbi:hypothetical protein [Glutamicibacter uratoxydans]|uniref:hypothetical protein n=1 Tax=Glutamicibacter uratoxydans TaxID=43667 RepID=UPI003D6EF56E
MPKQCFQQLAIHGAVKITPEGQPPEGLRNFFIASKALDLDLTDIDPAITGESLEERPPLAQ